VLRLVNRHLNSKEIAGLLGISSHTVDQRVRGAIRVLGVARRSEAARLLHEYEQAMGVVAEEAPATPDATIDATSAASLQVPAQYQQLIHQAPHIDPDPDQRQPVGAVSFQIRHADRTGKVGAERLDTEQRPVQVRPSLSLPWSTPQQARNAWNVKQRLAMIAGVAIVSSFSVGMLLAGLESLSRLLQS
jgi:hypothetical protein